jgi:hypothetical protein
LITSDFAALCCVNCVVLRRSLPGRHPDRVCRDPPRLWIRPAAAHNSRSDRMLPSPRAPTLHTSCPMLLSPLQRAFRSRRRLRQAPQAQRPRTSTLRRWWRILHLRRGLSVAFFPPLLRLSSSLHPLPPLLLSQLQPSILLSKRDGRLSVSACGTETPSPSLFEAAERAWCPAPLPRPARSQ